MDSPQFFTARRLILAAAVAIGIGALAPASALADACSRDGANALYDSERFQWDTNSNGSLNDGGNDPNANNSTSDAGERNDAWDGFWHLSLSLDGVAFTGYSPTDINGCTFEDGSRELVFPARSIHGLDVSRKLFVPDTGTPFGRLLTVLTNPTGSDITVTIRFDSNLGSDGDTIVTGSSSGDNAAAVGDAWAATGGDSGDPQLSHNWDSQFGAQDLFDAITPVGNGEDSYDLDYQNVTVPAGGTYIYMFIHGQRLSDADANAAANEFATVPEYLFAAMTEAEIGQLRNWCGGPTRCDRDQDGTVDTTDNCVSVSNADQADQDGDGRGDACDNDIDGDGLSNTAEGEFGTNPRDPDSDGDGVNDRQDACPTRSGGGADGCPVLAAAAAAPAADSIPPKLEVTLPSTSTSLASFIRGIDVAVDCDEPCQAKVRALGRMPTGDAYFSQSSGFNRVLARRNLPFSDAKRSVRVRPCEKTPGGVQSTACVRRFRKAGSRRQSFLVKIYVIAEDRAGNRSETSKLIRVRR